MIPKILHLCWLSGDPFPKDIQNCIDTWKYYLPDYEIWLWDKEKFDIESTLWTKQAYDSGKYAFAADYIRLYALYNYGGIYLDSDVIVYKSFDDLLNLPYFIGQAYERQFETAITGAERGLKWISDILERYKNRSFILEDGSLDTLSLPRVFYSVLKDKYSFYRLHSLEPYTYKDDIIYVFDQDFFNSRDCLEVRKTIKSYCAHNYAGSWTTPPKGIKAYIKKIMPKLLVKIYLNFTHNTISKKRIRKFEPHFINE